MEQEKKIFQELEEKRYKKLYIELPNLLHEIFNTILTPLVYDENLLKGSIEDAKKIVKAECEAAISYSKNLK